jgi:hypothetical protein
MFKVPTQMLTKILSRIFTPFDDKKNEGSELAKATHVSPQKVLLTVGSSAPMVSSESIVLTFPGRSSGGLKRVRTINKMAGQEMARSRRDDYEYFVLTITQ